MEAFPQLHGVQGKTRLLGTSLSLGYLHPPGPIHHLLVSGSEFQFQVASLVIQIADKNVTVILGSVRVPSCGNYHSHFFGVTVVGGIFKEQVHVLLGGHSSVLLSYIF